MTLEKEVSSEDINECNFPPIDTSIWSMTVLPCRSLDGLWEQYVITPPLLGLYVIHAF